MTEHVENTGYKPIWQPFVDESIRKAKWLAPLAIGGGAIAVVGLFFMYRAAAASRRAVLELRRAAQTELLSQLLSEYSSPTMLNSIRGLYRWQQDHPGDFITTYVDALEKREAVGEELEAWRRHAFRYFHKVQMFSDEGLIDSKLINRTLAPTAAAFVVNVLGPLTTAQVNSNKLSKNIVKSLSDQDREAVMSYYRGLQDRLVR